MRERPGFDRVGRYFLAAADGPIRLREDCHQLRVSAALAGQPIEQRLRDSVGAEEDEAERNGRHE